MSDIVNKQDLVKEQFNWEVPIEAVPLPSQGKVYQKSSPLYGKDMIEIKAMTAREEDILMSPGLIKQGKVVSHLLSSCLVDKSINPDEMLSGDRNAVMVAIRITGYGSDYTVNTTCPNCSVRSSQSYSLGQLGIKRLTLRPVSDDENIFEFRLPVTGKTVHFKFLSGKEEAERSLMLDRMKKMTNGEGIDRDVTSKLEYQIVSIDGISDRNAIRQFISKMPARDSKNLRNFIINNEPGIDLEVDIHCPECLKHGRVALPIGANFFWPE
jgi:hypothetical protein